MTSPYQKGFMFLSAFKGDTKMKTLTYFILTIVLFNSVSFSNGGPPPAPPLFKAKNKGAVYQAPLIIGKNTNALFARLSYVAVSELDGKIKMEGTSTNPQGTANGKNFEWQTPTMLFNIGISAKLSENAALILNLELNKMDELKVSGFELAYCGMLVNDENHKFRLMLGINIHPKDFQWYTDSSSFSLNQSSNDYDPTIGFIYNSDFENWLVNPFVQFSYSCQTLYDSGDEKFSTEVYKNVNVFGCTPGISYNFNDNLRTVFGVTFNYVDKIENSKNFVLTPQLQFSFYW